MLSWQLHGTTPETPHKNIFNMAAIVMDDISSDSGSFCDSKLYHSYFRYNTSFIDPPLGDPPRSGSINDKNILAWIIHEIPIL